MTTSVLNVLPLDDDEAAVLTQAVEWWLTEVEETSRTDERSPAARAAELERLAGAFESAAQVMRMVERREVLVGDARLLDVLGYYEAEHADALPKLRGALRKRAGYAGRDHDEQVVRDYAERLATCRGLLGRAQTGAAV